jgi:hypothetical protein
MRSRLQTALLIMLGSLLLYCGQDAVTRLGNGGGGRDGGGPVGSASADSGSSLCCTPPDPPPPTLIFDGELQPTPMPMADVDRLCTGSSGSTREQCCVAVTPSWDVSAYRSVVVHIDHCESDLRVQYQYGGAGFVDGPSVSCSASTVLLTVDPHLGKQIRLNFDGRTAAGYPDGYASSFGSGVCTDPPQKITVVGLK